MSAPAEAGLGASAWRRRWVRLGLYSGVLLVVLAVAGMLFVTPAWLVALPYPGFVVSLAGLLAGWTRRLWLPMRVVCVVAGAALATAVCALAAFASFALVQNFTDGRRQAALVGLLAGHPPPSGMRVRRLEEKYTGGSSICFVAAILELEHERSDVLPDWFDLMEEVEDHYEDVELRAGEAWYAIEPSLYVSRGTDDDSKQHGVLTVSLIDKQEACF